MKNINQNKMFDKLPDDMLKKYVNDYIVKSFDKKEIAFTPYSHNDFIYLVLKGRIRVSLSYPNGKEFTIAILEKGDVYSGHARGQGLTLDYTELALLPLRVFQEMIKEYPSFAMNVLSAVGSTLQNTFNIIEDLVFRDVNERLYSFILTMVESKGIVTKNGVEVPLGLTQEEIATMIGSTRQSVNAILTDLQKQNIISFHRKNLIVYDVEKISSFINRATSR